MSESTVRMKIGNCERWWLWASALARRGIVSRRGAPLGFRWLRRSGAARTRVHAAAGVRQSLQLHMNLSAPINLQIGMAFARNVSEHARRLGELRTTVASANDSVERRTGSEQISTNFAEFYRSEFLRTTIDRTQRVEHRVATRDLVLVRQQAQRTRSAAEEYGRTAAEWPAGTTAMTGYNQPVPAPSFNVDQIADTVMRQLDRRIGSWRERMGRL